MPENTRSSEPPITTDDLFQGAVLADNRFSRFDDELIDKYFNDDGKAAIEAYIASKVEKAKTLPKALEHAYKIRIAELEKQIKVVEDFAYVIQALQSKEGEK